MNFVVCKKCGWTKEMPTLYAVCPTCNIELNEQNAPYCESCGTKIKGDTHETDKQSEQYPSQMETYCEDCWELSGGDQ